jgi:hypothetical protein
MEKQDVDGRVDGLGSFVCSVKSVLRNSLEKKTLFTFEILKRKKKEAGRRQVRKSKEKSKSKRRRKVETN